MFAVTSSLGLDDGKPKPSLSQPLSVNITYGLGDVLTRVWPYIAYHNTNLSRKKFKRMT